MKYESAPNKVLTYCSYGTHGAVRNSMAETESRSMISAYGQLIIRNYCSPAPRVRDYVSQTYELDRIIW